MSILNHVVVAALSALLGTTLIALAFLYPLAMRPLVRSGDSSLVERARKDASLRMEMSNGPKTFPIVMHLTDRNCVELRSTLADGAGSYLVCYDARTGQKLEERLNMGF
jgi:hypothetical protein